MDKSSNYQNKTRLVPNEQERTLNTFWFSKWGDPQYIAHITDSYQKRESKKLVAKTASSVTVESQRWVLINILAEGELTIVCGSPNTGKTTFVCLVAAGVTRGRNYQPSSGLKFTGTGYVIIFNVEDNWAKTLKSRLEAAGADMDMVIFINCRVGHMQEEPFSFSRDRDIDRLIALAEQYNNNIGLIIIDPIYFAVDGDPNNNFKAREAYERLAALAKRLTCAILGVSHSVKNPLGKDLLSRVAGPPALREVPRCILYLSKIRNGPSEVGGTHVLATLKNNIGSMDGGFEFRIKGVEIAGQNGPINTSIFDITRELHGSTEEILYNADYSKPVEIISKLDAAIDFLLKVLKDEPRLLIDIEKLAEKVDIKKATLINAKKSLGIVSEKQKGHGRSLWSMPNTEVNDAILDDGL